MNKLKHIKLEVKGDDAVGLTITGNPQRPEPAHVRISFPWGDVEVTRATDGAGPVDYWVHVRANRPGVGNWNGDTDREGVILAARLDQTDKSAHAADLGDFDRPELYHLAVRIGAKPA